MHVRFVSNFLQRLPRLVSPSLPRGVCLSRGSLLHWHDPRRSGRARRYPFPRATWEFPHSQKRRCGGPRAAENTRAPNSGVCVLLLHADMAPPVTTPASSALASPVTLKWRLAGAPSNGLSASEFKATYAPPHGGFRRADVWPRKDTALGRPAAVSSALETLHEKVHKRQ